MIAIEAVTFNHTAGAATHDALNIRRNAAQTVHIPEWRRFISVTGAQALLGKHNR
jgi:hypothetical protein